MKSKVKEAKITVDGIINQISNFSANIEIQKNKIIQEATNSKNNIK